ncbi:MAG: VWA domain-containing protein [Candidatus Dormibacteria bacterium]
MSRGDILPFSALVGQEPMKTALVLNAVNPAIGGVLIRGQRGTAKSTAVRGLARLLPDIEMVEGCRFHCSLAADGPRCWECVVRIEAGQTLRGVARPMRVVELPVNASEDRVVGTIDLEAAVTRGVRAFEPGVLADANRNILYVDEVNLLDDHIVDVLLDAAAMGQNRVEREGVSAGHPSRFILVGTMNPEEGELRPQLLDRFGLCVDVAGLSSVTERVMVMERDAARQFSASTLRDDNAAAEDRLRDVIAKARGLLPLIELPAAIRWFVALVCVEAGVLGHRADIVVSRAARTLCALREAERAVSHGLRGLGRERPADALSVTPEDVIIAVELALPHRRRERPGTDSSRAPTTGDLNRERLDDLAQQAAAASVDAETQPEEAETSTSSEADAEPGDQSSAQRGDEISAREVVHPDAEEVFVGDLFPVKSIKLPRERKSRSTTGKRSSSESRDRRGRYVRARQTEHTTDVAFDATLRAAAPHQPRRRAERGHQVAAPALHLERQDLRQKVRRRRTGTFIVFVVDASASMDAEQRMQATKGAVLSLLRDAYLRRDKVALVVFNGRAARVALQPTNSVDLAESRLQRLAVGGTTPLTHGLVAGLKLVRNERLRDPTILPLIVLISDGRGNISLFGEEPLVEAQRVASQLGQEKVRVLIIDSARDYGGLPLPQIGILAGHPFGGYGFNACMDLADRSNGEYLGLYDLSQGAILAGVEKSLRGR